jgi:inosine/xanthosine triphosphate pyrophosphatase family protein
VKLLFATHNLWKTQLFAPVFHGYGFDMLTLNEVAVDTPPLQENGLTAIENALTKARHYHSEAYPWVFGDDAGLEIDALSGEPGVQARRWGGVFQDDVNDAAWLDYLLEQMVDVPAGKRTAAFVAGWALLDPDGGVHTRQIRAPFEIATHPIRPISTGSPITAVRLGPPDDLTRRQAEIRAAWQEWGILEELLKK